MCFEAGYRVAQALTSVEDPTYFDCNTGKSGSIRSVLKQYLGADVVNHCSNTQPHFDLDLDSIGKMCGKVKMNYNKY